MNPQISKIASQLAKSTSATEQADALDQLCQLAGDKEPVAFLLEQWNDAAPKFYNYKHNSDSAFEFCRQTAKGAESTLKLLVLTSSGIQFPLDSFRLSRNLKLREVKHG